MKLAPWRAASQFAIRERAVPCWLSQAFAAREGGLHASPIVEALMKALLHRLAFRDEFVVHDDEIFWNRGASEFFRPR